MPRSKINLRSRKRLPEIAINSVPGKRPRNSNPRVETEHSTEPGKVVRQVANASNQGENSQLSADGGHTSGQSVAPATNNPQTSAATAPPKSGGVRIEEARKQLQLKKRAMDEKYKRDLQKLHEEFQAQVNGCEETTMNTEDLTARSAFPDSSVHEWLAQLSSPTRTSSSWQGSESVMSYEAGMSDCESVTTAELAKRLTTLREPRPSMRFSAVQESKIERSLAELTQVLSNTFGKLGAYNSGSGSSRRWLPEKELVTFSGDPLEWFMFKKAFEASMRLNQYSDEENVLRLHRCLHGEAKEAVASLIVSSNNVKPIMNVLQLRYGNPNIIAQSTAREIRHLPTVDKRRGNLVTFATKVRNCVAAVEGAGHKGLLYSPELAENIVRKMPQTLIPSYHHFYNERKALEEPVLVTLSSFLFKEAELACQAQTIIPASSGSRRSSSEHHRSSHRKRDERVNKDRNDKVYTVKSSNYEEKKSKSYVKRCNFCNKEGHATEECRSLARTPAKQRWLWASNQRRCFLCLKTGHSRANCQSLPCDIDECGQRHHRLLHSDSMRANAEEKKRKTDNRNSEVTLSAHGEEGKVLLKVLPITLFGPRGSIRVNALLDEGSTVSILNAEVANQIGLKGERKELTITGVLGVATSLSSRVVSVEIQGPQSERHQIHKVKTIPGFTVSSSSISRQALERFPHLATLPIKVKDEVPKFLIGQDNWDLIVTRELKVASPNQPVASLTNLGWVVHGYMSSGKHVDAHCNFTSDLQDKVKTSEDEELQEMVKNSFKLESIGVSRSARKPRSEVRAEEILRSTTRRCGDHWETGLLWKNQHVNLPNNYGEALKRLESLKRKFRRDPELKKMYATEVKKLLKSGFARRVEDSEMVNQRVWYLPHFDVKNVNKPGRVRMVFDAASEFNGVSLNNQLLSGPDLLQSLFGVLLRFRQGAIAFSGDIQDMFLRIKIQEEDQAAQRFLWRDEEKDEPVVYAMTSLIFGATSSPCSAIYVKNLNAEDFRESCPEAVDAIVKKHYMDDYLDSVDSVKEGIKLVQEVTKIHQAGSFRIRKWISNNKEILAQIPKSELSEKSEEKSLERVLGVKWDSETDSLKFDLKIEEILKTCEEKGCTKRRMLKAVMSIFDPLGMLTPLTIKGRILLQTVWRSEVGWDDNLKEEEMKLWSQWKKFLPYANGYEVPRCYFHKIGPRQVELHTFADASEEAFAAVSYLRVVYEDSSIGVAFVAGKARVAPVKPLSIPRLELQAALVASRLAKSVKDELGVEILKRVFWTDSKTVICWLKSDPRRYNVFVANRLGEIDELTDISEWRWVPSKMNVADDATRWKFEVNNESRWLNGPKWLFDNEDKWPVLQDNTSMKDKHCEVLTTLIVEKDTSSDVLPEANRFSSWLRLVRTSARVLQFFHLLKARREGHEANQGMSEVDLMARATELILAQSQRSSFSVEVACLKQGVPLSKRSRILQLAPFMDAKGVLRADARINRAEGIPETMKRPIILDGRNGYTHLLIYHFHRKNGHENTETVVNCLREHYAILFLRRAVKGVISKCQMCRVRKSSPTVPRMSELPPSRLSHHIRPFTNCGIDYFGPMIVKIGRRREKRWGVIFTCLSSRAVHLELAHSLTTDSTIMAIRRMASTRGCPSVIWSDNGTNLRGADTELRRAASEVNQGNIETMVANEGIEWRFIPPGAPHMGGCWERLIRSVKVSLAAILKEKEPPEETLKTLLAEVQNIVNSRPLTYLSYNPLDDVSLTPNHFLIGSAGGSAPGKFTDEDLCLKKEWRKSQRMADQFWNRWVREYLPELVPRRKWSEDQPNVQVDDVVRIVDNSLARNVWPKGRIVEVTPGRDGRVRMAKVQLERGNVLVRPVSKLAVLVKKNEA